MPASLPVHANDTSKQSSPTPSRPPPRRWSDEVDPNQATALLVLYCCMTGWIDAVGFSAAYIWVAFQTGNTIQNAIAIARLFSGPHPRSTTFQTSDAQALTSLVGFLIGSSLGRIGDAVGSKRRSWLVGGTLLQSLLTLAAALTIRQSSSRGPIAPSRNEAQWSDVYGFVTLAWISASMGLQSIMAKRCNTIINTSVVLTTIWTELVAEPALFKWTRRSKARDHRIYAIVGLVIGAILGRVVAAQSDSSAVALGVAAAIRALIAFAWYFIPT